MRLKELTLQGYKSFATKHRFEFPSVITAVVGPNGSGKSNIADGIRWALGEQRASALRARRTDEFIFAGTERRARAGLAEVSLSIDNTDGWLDIDFHEVVITRRAHRDGTNEYLINGSRVRLRDVLDLLGSRLGRGNYTVIGQGMVDNALSLTPEERRGLIDEAAGVVPLQRKRDAALRQLVETDENLTRVRDILAELGPRLRRMERLDKRAARHQELAAEMESLLAAWYGHHWHGALAQAREAWRSVEDLGSAAAAAHAIVSETQARLDGIQHHVAEAEAALARHRATREVRAAAAAAARQAAAVASARRDGLQARVREIATDQAGLAATLEVLSVRIAELGDEVADLRRRHDDAAVAASRAEDLLTATFGVGGELAEPVEAARAALFEQSNRLAASRSQCESLAGVERDRESRRGAAEAELVAVTTRLEQLSTDLDTRKLASTEAGRRTADAARAEAEAEAALAETKTALEAARQDHEVARARLTSLEMRQRGVEALLAQVDQGTKVALDLGGHSEVESLGQVLALLEVEPGWERAVAGSLGILASGIVLRDTAAVDRALSLIGTDGRGRLALIPLVGEDHPPRSWSPAAGEQRATAVVRSPRADGLVTALLGDVAFVGGLAAARAAVARADGPIRAACRTGHLVLAGGAVITGSPVGPAPDIAREMEALTAELPGALSAVAQLTENVNALSEQERIAAARLPAIGSARRAAESADREILASIESLGGQLERVRREQEWASAALSRITQELELTTRERSALVADIDAGERRESELKQMLDARLAEVEASELGSARANLAAASASATELAQALAACEARLEAAGAERQLLLERIAIGQERAAALKDEHDELLLAAERLGVEAAAVDEALAVADAELAPAEGANQAARSARQAAVRVLDEARQTAHERESEHAEARLAASRAEDRLERLFDQLLADAEWLPDDLALPATLDDAVASGVPLPTVAELSGDLIQRLPGLRREIKSIGAIDSEALAAYHETATRFAHLTEQRADLEAARRDLRTALETLEAEMHVRFDEAFEDVAAAFADFFPRLFSGGEAHLVATVTDDGTPGVDIVARPPGKRSQPLSLLSGGERALTAVALIFALLRVSRTPFVVLDEVDAALDEANIDRFCQALEALSADTQVVIVTHNRGTIQRAGTVYGVTMADDGASQVISLQVDNAR